MKKVIIILLTMSLTKLLISCCNPPGPYYFYTITDGIETTIYERIDGEQEKMQGGVTREFLVLKVNVITKTASDSAELSFNGFTFNSAQACNDYGAIEHHLDIIDSLKIYAGIPDSIAFEEVTDSFVVLSFGNFEEIDQYFSTRYNELRESPYEGRYNHFDMVFARNFRGFPDGTSFKVEAFLSSGSSFLSYSDPIIFDN